MEAYLPVIWALILALAVTIYVILDGFDLGLGILFPTAREEGERDQMMNSVAPFWDGNETWLVLGGTGLLVAFPPAYAIIMPALYLPVIAMLLGLILRGVAFEFRWVAKPKHHAWDAAFFLGSTIATFSQGLILGGLLQGIRHEGGQFTGGTFDWATPFSLLCGLGLVAGYALLGACWLMMKTEGPLAERSRRQGTPLLILVLLFVAAVSVWTPMQFPRIAARWFSTPNIFFLWPVPLVTAWLAWECRQAMVRGHEIMPFLTAMGLFLLCFLGLGISTFPYLVPPTLTVWQAAAAPSSQIFVLIGVAFLLPVILGYVVFVYWTFRGKVKPGEGYH